VIPLLKQPKPGLVVFDLDGTLVDSLAGTLAAMNGLRADLDLHALGRDQVLGAMGGDTRAFLGAAIPEAASRLDDDGWQHLLLAWGAAYTRLALPLVRTYDGVVGVLRDLHELGIKTAILSNKRTPLVLETLDRVGLSDWFAREDVVGAGAPRRPKPWPDGLIALVSRHRVRPAQAWMVGDSDVDVRAGRAAGCVTVACRYGYGDAVREGADVEIDAPAELLDVFDVRWTPESARPLPK